MAYIQNHSTVRHLLLVGGPYNMELHKYWYTTAKEAGIVISTADKPGHWSQDAAAEGLMHSFHPINLDLPTDELTDEIVRLVSSSDVKFSGVTTLIDKYLIAVAVAAQKLHMPTVGPDTFRNVQDKQSARIICNSSVRHFRIKSVDNLPEAVKTVGFPAVIKPVKGTDSLGVHYVNSADDLEKIYLDVRSQLPEFSAIIGEVSAILLEEYIKGTEHKMDLVIQNGEVLFASLCDSQSSGLPWFQGSADSYCSELENGDQSKIIDYATLVCQKLKMTDGVVHLELNFCEGEPQLVELNPRMGCAYVWHSVKTAWGVDLLQCAYKIALGLPVSLPNQGLLDPSRPMKAYVVTKQLNSPFTGYVLSNDYLLPFANDEKVPYVNSTVKVGQKVFGPEDNRPTALALLLFAGNESIKATMDYAENMMHNVQLQEMLSKQPPVKPLQEMTAAPA